MPFDWKNPCGFLAAIAILYGMLTCVALIGGSVLILAIGFYIYQLAVSKCIKENLCAIEESSRIKTERQLIRGQLIEFIEFHTKAKQLSDSILVKCKY